MSGPIRIGNCSGFYGDRMAAAREMVEGGPIDVLCGDYLAELTMLILAKAQAKDPNGGYARTFLTQMEQVLGTCLDRRIKVVANAGGLNPAGLATALRELAARLGLTARVAHVEGDDLRGSLDAITPPVGETKPVSANAYLGAWGITEALRSGADVVVTGRVTDASLVVGPAAWWHSWAPGDWDRLAGAVVAGHVIECGPQATGGNYAFLGEVTDRRYPGFPIAEIAEPAYLGPDVVTHFDTIRLSQRGEHRVAISGTKGSHPPDTLKVALNELGGFRNSMTMVLTGLDIEEKAAFAEQQLFDVLGGRDAFDEVDVRLLRFDVADAPTNEQACAHLRVTVKDADPRKVGRAFSGGIMEIALAGFAGFHTTTPPSSETAFGIYRPALVPRTALTHVLVDAAGNRHAIADPPTGVAPSAVPAAPATPPAPTGPTRRAPLGSVLGARSGDKGGNANLGLWARDDRGYAWAREYLSVERLRTLLGPEAANLRIERFELPNLRALNVVVFGLLGDGVASSTRPDAQAKGFGEYVRSRVVDIPESLLDAR
ncbi:MULTISPECIES: acyclic terpene utilization AtuA family protein [Mycobacteriaceae]|uniref:acyclic terpene utilization AtuA family protein n=1 Tax=Mycolicibacterium TaxID=1866885 RepID=UPI00076A1B7C|nr:MULTISPECIES: acyclic terpene utilization AtuA family protein [Mycolicibacterium]MCT7365057.1 exopolyphosphatase [Mycolicibacterium llatzerense]MCT7373029.1 exopolyphosphatase [Mycolicibacterium llatzerense]MCX8560429.1 DUF1446 domain-containing protein [Mycolicibacterium mucogenicum]